jgi:hypothetical protein
VKKQNAQKVQVQLLVGGFERETLALVGTLSRASYGRRISPSRLPARMSGLKANTKRHGNYFHVGHAAHEHLAISSLGEKRNGSTANGEIQTGAAIES